MRRVIALFAMLSSALILTACRTTYLASVDKTTICRALERADPLSALSDEERRIVRESFTRQGKDALKMARALRKEIGCI